MRIYFKLLSVLSGVIGGVIILSFPFFGSLLIALFVFYEIFEFFRTQREHEKKEQFDFQTAKSLVRVGGENPYKAIIQQELKNNGKLEDIIPKYKRVFKIDDTDQDALSTILAGYGVLLNHEIAIYGQSQRKTLLEAEKFVSKALKMLTSKWHTQSLIHIALIYDAGKYFRKSKKIYERLMKLDPTNINVIDSYGMSCLMNGRTLDAIKLLEDAVNNKNFTFITLYNLGCAKQALGHFSVSNFYLHISFRLHRSWKPLALLSKNYFLMGQFKEAFVTRLICNILGGRNQKDAYKNSWVDLTFSIMYGLAFIISITVGRIPFIGRFYYKAVKPSQWFEELLKLHVDKYPDPYYQSANLAERLLLIDPKNEIVLYNLAIFNAKLGKKDKMLECFDKIEQTEFITKTRSELENLNIEELKRQEIQTVALESITPN